MKDFTINGWSLRFDNGTSKVIREARGITEENALDGITGWAEMAPWILYGGLMRGAQRRKEEFNIGIEEAKVLIDDLSPSETVDLINAYVKAMTVIVEDDQQVATEGESTKKS